MKVNLYVINDSVACQSSPVFEANNDGMALRHLKQALEKVPDENKNEFQLLRVGTIDHEKNITEGTLSPTVVLAPKINEELI